MRAGVLVAAIVLAIPAITAQSAQTRNPAVTKAIAEAFEAAYNLDHQTSIDIARRAVALGPDEPATHRTLAAMIWLQILYRRGTVTIDHYLGGLSRSDIVFPKPPADLHAEFTRELERSLALATARVTRFPRDVQARFDLGAAHALRASYTASVEGRIGAAFMSAKRAFDQQEEVLERDPTRTDAGLVVGVYRYIVATFSWPTRFMAYVIGFGGDKERAFGLLEAAAANEATRVDARTALMLIFSREGRHGEVERIARELQRELPRNRLLILEEGAAAIRAGHGEAADAALTRGLAVLAKDPREKVPGERALWLYKRGLARLNLNHPADASVDLHEALGADPAGWVRGRIQVQLGKIEDMAGRRGAALQYYRIAKSTCEANRDLACASEAGRWIGRPFIMGK